MLASIDWLAERAGALPENPTPAELADWIAHLVDDAAIGADDADRADIHESMSLLRSWANAAPIETDRIGPLLRTLWRQSNRTTDPIDGVWFGRIGGARHLRFAEVFCAGFTESAFPQPAPGNAVYSEHDLDALSSSGIELRDRNWHEYRQSALFRRLFEVPVGNLTISWPADGLSGSVEWPSPYAADVRSLFEGLEVEQCRSAANVLLPPTEEIGSRRDWRNHALNQETAVDTVDDDGYRTATIGSEVESARYSDEPFSVYDGVLQSPEIRSELATFYDDGHAFSATELQLYLGCPFRFSLERLLKVSAMREPGVRFDAAVRGTIVHRTLEQFYAHSPDTKDQPDEERLLGLLDENFARYSELGVPVPNSVREVEHQRLRRAMSRYLENASANDPAWSPAHFEWNFGNNHSDHAPFVLETEHGVLCLQGKIDRIDRDGESENLRIVDYKTGDVPALKVLKNGLEIQLSLYTIAVENILGKPVVSAVYEGVGQGKQESRDIFQGGHGWDPVAAKPLARQQLAAAAEGIRAGNFSLPPDSATCGFCPKNKVCRWEKARVENKLE